MNGIISRNFRFKSSDFVSGISSDQDIFKIDLGGIFLGNYVPWDANKHIELVKNQYNFKISNISFDRTYRTMSNLDDMHENGVHDYLKYIKFGYGRATDHPKIRSEASQRQGNKLVKNMIILNL